MSAFKPPGGLGMCVAVSVAMSLLLVTASGAMASGIKVCVPAAAGGPILTPIKGACPRGYTLAEPGKQGPTAMKANGDRPV